MYTPKPDGSSRPQSILCLEDKAAQHEVVYVLEATYDEYFLGFSYPPLTPQLQTPASSRRIYAVWA